MTLIGLMDEYVNIHTYLVMNRLVYHHQYCLEQLKSKLQKIIVVHESKSSMRIDSRTRARDVTKYELYLHRKQTDRQFALDHLKIAGQDTQMVDRMQVSQYCKTQKWQTGCKVSQMQDITYCNTLRFANQLGYFAVVLNSDEGPLSAHRYSQGHKPITLINFCYK
jgi:hypothetical protein